VVNQRGRAAVIGRGSSDNHICGMGILCNGLEKTKGTLTEVGEASRIEDRQPFNSRGLECLVVGGEPDVCATLAGSRSEATAGIGFGELRIEDRDQQIGRRFQCAQVVLMLGEQLSLSGQILTSRLLRPLNPSDWKDWRDEHLALSGATTSVRVSDSSVLRLEYGQY